MEFQTAGAIWITNKAELKALLAFRVDPKDKHPDLDHLIWDPVTGCVLVVNGPQALLVAPSTWPTLTGGHTISSQAIVDLVASMTTKDQVVLTSTNTGLVATWSVPRPGGPVILAPADKPREYLSAVKSQWPSPAVLTGTRVQLRTSFLVRADLVSRALGCQDVQVYVGQDDTTASLLVQRVQGGSGLTWTTLVMPVRPHVWAHGSS